MKESLLTVLLLTCVGRLLCVLCLSGLCEGVQQDVYFPGFPTLKHLQHSVGIRETRVCDGYYMEM